MFRQYDKLRVCPCTQRQRDLASQAEARAAVRDPDQVITEAVPRQLLAVGCTGEVVRGVGMRVIDVSKREKPMQEGLNGGTRAARLVEAVREVVDHLSIAHALAFKQGKHILQEQPGKRGFYDSRQIRAGAFDPQNTCRATAKIDLVRLGRGIAASPVADRAVRSQLTRARDQLR